MAAPITRRSMLGHAARAGLAAGAGAPALAAPDRAPQEATPPRKRLKVIVAGGHPGDPEYGCGGTILRYTDLGHQVALLYLNRGDWGFLDEPPKGDLADRVAEATRACEILQARPLFASQLNGRSIVDRQHAEEILGILAAEKPDVLITQWPVDGHADHRAIFALTYEAWLRTGKQAALYFYEVSDGEDTLLFAPTHHVDITSVEPRKRAACFAHASQSPERYYDLQSRVTAFRGLEGGHRHAEAYIRHARSGKDLLPDDLLEGR
jgi:LmbE family N-acetylglucosaminyl deacetylase